jgi:hypothetical protein
VYLSSSWRSAPSTLVAALMQACPGLAYRESGRSGQYCALTSLAQYFT